MSDLVDTANLYVQHSLDRVLHAAKMPAANDVTQCVDCGEQISPQRKAAVPHALRCVHCQAVLEGHVQECNA